MRTGRVRLGRLGRLCRDGFAEGDCAVENEARPAAVFV